MPVREMLARFTSHELAELMVYERLEPFGEAAAERRFAITATILANAHRDPKRKKTPFLPADFYPPMVAPTPPRPNAKALAERLKATLMQRDE